jgi:hypothetical protein
MWPIINSRRLVANTRMAPFEGSSKSVLAFVVHCCEPGSYFSWEKAESMGFPVWNPVNRKDQIPASNIRATYFLHVSRKAQITKSSFRRYWRHGSLHLILIGIEICGIKVASTMRKSNIRLYCLINVAAAMHVVPSASPAILSRLSGCEWDKPVYSLHLSKGHGRTAEDTSDMVISHRWL